MSISHREAFELFHRGMEARLHFGPTQLLEERLQAEALAGLPLEQRGQLQAHWAACPECRMDVRLSASLRSEAIQRWPLSAAPRRTAADLIQAAQTHGHAPARGERLMAPLRLALIAALLVGAILALSWVLNYLRPHPAVLPAVETPSAPPPSPTPQPPQTPTASPAAFSKTPLAPLIPFSRLEVASWSPDGRYLLLTRMEASQDARSDRVYTSVEFYDAQTGGICQAGEPFLGSLDMISNSAWLPDGRLLTLALGDVNLFRPCSAQIEDISALFDDRILQVNRTREIRQQLVLTGEKAYWIFDAGSDTAFPLAEPVPSQRGSKHVFWSPDEEAIGISQPPEGTDAAGSQLWLVDIRSGRILETISVPLGNQDYAPWTEWLLEDVLLVYGGSNQSSILVERQTSRPARLTSVLKDIFDLEVQPPAMLSGEGALSDPGRGTYHLVLAYLSPEKRALYLYHSETGQVETLPHDYDTYLFSTNGDTIWMPRFEAEPTYTDGLQLVWLDDPARPSQQIVAQGHTPRGHPNLSSLLLPDSGRIAFASTQGVSLVSIDDGRLLAFWSLEGAEESGYVSLSLSPDGQTLAVKAGLPTSPDSALYMLSLPP